jgi:hypothetical protein
MIAETKDPLPNVSITIQNPSWGYTFSTTTDGYGRYFQKVVSGDHSLTYKLNGYESITVSGISVSRNETVTRDVSLLPGDLYSLIYLPLLVRDWSPKRICH